MSTSVDRSGAEVARGFHADLVAPLLRRELPDLRYAAARLGSGSDVLGLDDAMSRDHDWGCRLTLLLDEADQPVVATVAALLERQLPETYQGLPVRFGTTWDARTSYRVEVATVSGFATSRLGLDPLPGLSTYDWLTVTGQGVLELTAGPVFSDTTETLRRVRDQLAWYPPDVERYVLAAGWQRMCQLMPMIGRTADRGQQLQSRLIASSVAADAMYLGFLVSRRWAPYAKWRETTFGTLPIAAELLRPLDTAVTGADWHTREAALATALEVLGRAQRVRGLPTPESVVTPFYDRPYRTVDPAVVTLLREGIADPDLLRLPPGIGSVEQWVDNVDVLAHPHRRVGVVGAYHHWAGH